MRVLENELYKSDILRVLEGFNYSLLKKKKILITGATGLICSTIVDILIMMNRIYDLQLMIYVAVRDEEKALERFGQEAFVKVIFYNAIDTELFLDVDYMIHGAGNATPDLFVTEPVETILANIIGVNRLLDYCKLHKHVRMVYVSSSEVYGNKTTVTSFDEKDYGIIDQDNLRNSYAEAKRAAEMLCRAYAREYGIKVSMVRPGHIFGPSALKKDKRISSEFAYKSANGLPLELLSSGHQTRSYCYCVDCAMAILFVLLKGESGEAYNIGTEEITSIKEMVTILAEAGNVPLSIKEATEEEKLAFNPMDNSSLSKEKIAMLGYQQRFGAKEGLIHTVQIMKECMKC